MSKNNNHQDLSVGLLQGLKVLDLSRVLAGPWSAQILGDLGAEVIKIEQPGKGDDTRSWGPPYLREGEGAEDLFSAYYLCCNRNKRSVAIDLSSKEGSELVRQLAAKCDVVIENFKVGGLAKYGLDYAALSAINPRLVYCSITGFGQDGPYAKRGGYDFLIQGMGGLMSMTGPAVGSPGSEPTKTGVAVIDLFTGLYATIAILAALRERESSGQGQHIDAALLDSAVAILANQGMNWMVGKKVPQPMGNGHPNVVPYRAFPVADGDVIVTVGNDSQFKALCRVLGCDEFATQPEFATNEARVANRARLEAELSMRLCEWRRDELLAEFSANGVPGGPINRVDQVYEDPQVQFRQMIEEHYSPGGSTLSLTRFPMRFSRTPATIRSTPPAIGAQTLEVLSGLLDLSKERIDHLIEAGAVAALPPR